MEEEWKIYKDNRGKGRGALWEVSNYGNVKKNGSFYQLNLGNSGYYYFCHWLVHKAIAEIFVFNPDPEHKLHIDHIDGNKLNNRANNLRWCTRKENMNNPITIERLSMNHKGKTPWNKGKPRSEQTKSKISATKKGKHLSEEHKAKIGAALKGAHKGLYWFNNGIIEIRAYECPEGFSKGRITCSKT